MVECVHWYVQKCEEKEQIRKHFCCKQEESWTQTDLLLDPCHLDFVFPFQSIIFHPKTAIAAGKIANFAANAVSLAVIVSRVVELYVPFEFQI